MDSKSYFDGYEDLEVHELMLKDRPRQETYYKAIVKNADYFKNKVVLDVGAGTGILSIFCAKAGARLVYAVEASNLAGIALEVVSANDLTSVVKVIQSKIEDFELPTHAEKVDVIVSEWMGFYLLHEGMLDSVLYARNKFLKPDGKIFPNEAIIYIAPCSVPSQFEYWNEVDGVCLSPFAAALRRHKSAKPQITTIRPDDLLHAGVVLHWMNLEDMDENSLEEIHFKEVVTTERAGKHQGFCIWFECRFPSDNYMESIALSTSPKAPSTHWKQCVIVLPDGVCEDLEENAPIAFKISMMRHNENRRRYNLEVDLLDPNTEEHPLPCNCHLTRCILTKAHLQKMDME